MTESEPHSDVSGSHPQSCKLLVAQGPFTAVCGLPKLADQFGDSLHFSRPNSISLANRPALRSFTLTELVNALRKVLAAAQLPFLQQCGWPPWRAHCWSRHEVGGWSFAGCPLTCTSRKVADGLRRYCRLLSVMRCQPACPRRGAAGHEEIERLERLIVKDFQTEAKSHKEKLHQNHRVKQALETMQSQAEQLVRIHVLPSRGCALVAAAHMRQACGTRSIAQTSMGSPGMQLQIYEDADGSRKEEITLLKGEDPMQYVLRQQPVLALRHCLALWLCASQPCCVVC